MLVLYEPHLIPVVNILPSRHMEKHVIFQDFRFLVYDCRFVNAPADNLGLRNKCSFSYTFLYASFLVPVRISIKKPP